ncbi:MAG: Kdo hydroxylase family protein [Burkholderiales bacterium]
MAQNEIIEVLDGREWHFTLAAAAAARATLALEAGKVLFFPQLAFGLEPGEQRFLTPACSDGKAKNISYDSRGAVLQGTSLTGKDRAQLAALIARFALHARALIESLLPAYSPQLQPALTSYRPLQVERRGLSARKDDSRLHMDAFASRPNQGKRILRVFTNLNPHGEARVWDIGEPFERFAPRYVPHISMPLPGSAWLLRQLHITKGRRSPYDHVMLQLHDRVKLDHHYQQSADKLRFHFPPGSTWVVYSDRVLHAALSGQYLLEQTFYLPASAMQDENLSPLRILERLYQRELAA